MLADIQVGTDIFIRELQGIIDAFEVFADPSFNPDISDSKRNSRSQMQLLVSEVLAYASANQNFQKLCEPQLLEDLMGMLKSDDEEVSARIFVATSKLILANEKIRSKFFSEPKKMVSSMTTLLASSHVTKETTQWIIEAFSFLSLDPEIKELICFDNKITSYLFNLCKNVENSSLFYGVTVLFYNICHYIKQNDEVEQLQQQLKRFASGEGMKKIEIHPLNQVTRCDWSLVMIRN